MSQLDDSLATLQDLAEPVPSWRVDGEDALFVGADALRQARAENLRLFLAATESDQRALAAVGVLATTTWGGFDPWASDTAGDIAGSFEGLDVVVVAGEYPKKAPSICKALRAAGAKAVRLLELPGSGAALDWIDTVEKPADRLYALAKALPLWKPTDGFRSHFGAVHWDNIEATGTAYEWLVKGIIARGELAMMAGPSQSGKSFLAIDLAMSVARGVPWRGAKTHQGGVLYCAGESAYGVRRLRLPAYRRFHNCAHEKVDFVMMSRAVDLASGDDPTNLLIEEARHWQEHFTRPIQLIVIDTLSSSIVGADENLARDITPVLARCARIRDALNCAVLLVHHMNALGEKPRGSTALMANVESVILCRMDESRRDADNRKIREIKLAKQKDGESEKTWRFVLPAVEIGKDEDGDPITSCIVAEPNMGLLDEDPPTTDQSKRPRLTDKPYNYLLAIKAALDEHGQTPPPEVKLPPDILVVHKSKVADAYAERWQGDEDDPQKRDQNLRAARMRLGEKLLAGRYIGASSPWIWITPKGMESVTPKRETSRAPTETVTTNAPDITDGVNLVTGEADDAFAAWARE